MIPIAPSSEWAHMKITLFSKCGSAMPGIAIRSLPSRKFSPPVARDSFVLAMMRAYHAGSRVPQPATDIRGPRVVCHTTFVPFALHKGWAKSGADRHREMKHDDQA